MKTVKANKGDMYVEEKTAGGQSDRLSYNWYAKAQGKALHQLCVIKFRSIFNIYMETES